MITENGFGKRTGMDEYIRADGPQNRGGYGLKGYQVTDKTGPVAAMKVVNESDDILIISDDGTIIRTHAVGINVYSRTAQGVKVISIARTEREEEEEETGLPPAGEEGERVPEAPQETEE